MSIRFRPATDRERHGVVRSQWLKWALPRRSDCKEHGIAYGRQGSHLELGLARRAVTLLIDDLLDAVEVLVGARGGRGRAAGMGRLRARGCRPLRSGAQRLRAARARCGAPQAGRAGSRGGLEHRQRPSVVGLTGRLSRFGVDILTISCLAKRRWSKPTIRDAPRTIVLPMLRWARLLGIQSRVGHRSTSSCTSSISTMSPWWTSPPGPRGACE